MKISSSYNYQIHKVFVLSTIFQSKIKINSQIFFRLKQGILVRRCKVYFLKFFRKCVINWQ